MEVGPPLLGMVVVVGDDVVEVAAAGVASAPREHARAVADDDVLADLRGGFVAQALEPLPQVDHLVHDDLDVGAAAPGADLLHGQQPLPGLLDPGAQHLVRAVSGVVVDVGDRVGGQVGVQHDLGHRLRAARLRFSQTRPPRPSSTVSASSGSSKPMVSWCRARSPSAVARRPSMVSVEPEPREVLGPRVHRLRQREGVGDLQVGLQVHGAVEGALLGVEGDVPLVRRRRQCLLDLVGHVPHPGLLDQPPSCDGVSREAHQNTCSST